MASSMLLGLIVLGGVSAVGCQVDAEDSDITYPPTGLTAKAASATEIDLAWSGTNADFYYLLVGSGTSDSIASAAETADAGSDGTPISFDNTSASYTSVGATTYCFRVEGVAVDISSGPSDEVCAKTP